MTRAADGSPIRIRGAGAFVARRGTVSVTWPLASAELDEWGVRVNIRPRWLKRLLASVLVQDVTDAAVWGQQWASIASLEVGPRSVVFRASDSRSGSCRVAVLRGGVLQSVIVSAERHAVPVRRVATTLGWYLGRPK